MAQYLMIIPLEVKTMKVETYIDQQNNDLYSLKLLKELYSSLSINSVFIEVGKDVTIEHYTTVIAKNWNYSTPFVVIDDKSVGNIYYVIRKFVRDGLVSSNFFQSADTA